MAYANTTGCLLNCIMCIMRVLCCKLCSVQIDCVLKSVYVKLLPVCILSYYQVPYRVHNMKKIINICIFFSSILTRRKIRKNNLLKILVWLFFKSTIGKSTLSFESLAVNIHVLMWHTSKTITIRIVFCFYNLISTSSHHCLFYARTLVCVCVCVPCVCVRLYLCLCAARARARAYVCVFLMVLKRQSTINL